MVIGYSTHDVLTATSMGDACHSMSLYHAFSVSDFARSHPECVLWVARYYYISFRHYAYLYHDLLIVSVVCHYRDKSFIIMSPIKLLVFGLPFY